MVVVVARTRSRIMSAVMSTGTQDIVSMVGSDEGICPRYLELAMICGLEGI